MRLIDGDRLLSERMKSMYYHLPNGDIAIPIIDIENAPAIEPEQKKGKWVPISTSDGKHHEWCGYQCSICGERTPRLMQYNFCPNCGADMRGGQDE